LLFTTGCISVTTWEPSKLSTGLPTDIRVEATKSRDLSVDFLLGDSQPETVVMPQESSLTDEIGQRFNLEFIPAASTNAIIERSRWARYSVRAYGPVPSRSRHSFLQGSYSLTAVFTEGGKTRESKIDFDIGTARKRRVPFFLIWFYPAGPCV